jgi:hypothetical protein
VDPDPLQSTIPTFDSGELVDTRPAGVATRPAPPVLARAGASGRSRLDFLTVVHEVVANGVVHGRPPVPGVRMGPRQNVCW